MGDEADILTQRAYYDQRWTEVGDDYANLLQLGRAVAVLQGLQFVNQLGPRILDLGCGTGWLAGILGRFGPTTAVDLSPVGIERARRLYPDVTFIAGDVLEVPLAPASFDVVVSVQVLDHMRDHAAFLDLAYRYLRPGGFLILVTTNARNIAHWDPRDFDEFCSSLQPVEHWLTVGQLRRLLEGQFRIHRLSTCLPGYGRRGIFRILHSIKLAHLLHALHMRALYDALLLRMGMGLVIFAVAQRPPVEVR